MIWLLQMVIFPVRFIQQPKGMMERGQDDDELEVWSEDLPLGSQTWLAEKWPN